MTNSQIYSAFAALGEIVEDDYVVNDDCHGKLKFLIVLFCKEKHLLYLLFPTSNFARNHA